MRLIDLDFITETLDVPYPKQVKSCTMEINGIPKYLEQFEKIDAIPVDWLHKQLIEAMYERKLSSEVLSVFHEILAKWRKENESNISD